MGISKYFTRVLMVYCSHIIIIIIIIIIITIIISGSAAQRVLWPPR
jgi:hypothetical protein